MRVRRLKESDMPVLQRMQEKNGYPYPDLNGHLLEAVLVVVDEDDNPLMAAAAHRLVEIYLWCGEFEKPHAQLHAVRLLHETMAEVLRQKHYSSAEAFLPPALAEKFGKRLEKTFGWVRNTFLCWTKTF